MEEGAVGLARFLTILDLHVGLIGIVVGLFTAVRLVPRAATQELPEVGLVERIVSAILGGLALVVAAAS